MGARPSKKGYLVRSSSPPRSRSSPGAAPRAGRRRTALEHGHVHIVDEEGEALFRAEGRVGCGMAELG